MQIVRDAFSDAGSFPKGLADSPELKATLESLTKHGTVIQKVWNKAMAAHPANVIIHTSNEFVESSLSAYRDLARVLTGDKAMANLMAETFLSLRPDDRFNMLYTTFKYYFDKIGAPEYMQREILEATFGDVDGFGPVQDFKTPLHFVDAEELRVAPGASQPLHLTRGVSMPNFNKIHQYIIHLFNTYTKDIERLCLLFFSIDNFLSDCLDYSAYSNFKNIYSRISSKISPMDKINMREYLKIYQMNLSEVKTSNIYFSNFLKELNN
jgi:hypothetical protein